MTKLRISRQDDRGSLSVEFVIVTPMIFIVLALIYAFGRVAEVNGVLDTGTRDAARVATQANSYQQADAAAKQVVRQEVGTGSKKCQDTLQVTVAGGDAANFRPGRPITVTATCTYALSDLGIPGAPASLTVSSQFTSFLDPNKTINNAPATQP